MGKSRQGRGKFPAWHHSVQVYFVSDEAALLTLKLNGGLFEVWIETKHVPNTQDLRLNGRKSLCRRKIWITLLTFGKVFCGGGGGFLCYYSLSVKQSQVSFEQRCRDKMIAITPRIFACLLCFGSTLSDTIHWWTSFGSCRNTIVQAHRWKKKLWAAISVAQIAGKVLNRFRRCFIKNAHLTYTFDVLCFVPVLEFSVSSFYMHLTIVHSELVIISFSAIKIISVGGSLHSYVDGLSNATVICNQFNRLINNPIIKSA